MAPPRRGGRRWVKLTDHLLPEVPSSRINDAKSPTNEDGPSEKPDEPCINSPNPKPCPHYYRIKWWRKEVCADILYILELSETPEAKGEMMADVIVEMLIALDRHADVLWEFWTWFVLRTCDFVGGHPSQEAMLECLKALMSREDYPWNTDSTFNMMLSEQWHSMDPEDYSIGEMRNFNNFMIRLERAEYEHFVRESSPKVVKPPPQFVMLVTIITGLERRKPDSDERAVWWETDMWEATDWFIEWADGVYSVMKGHGGPDLSAESDVVSEMSEALSEETPPWLRLRDVALNELGPDTPVYSIERWEFWKRRLAMIADKGLVEDRSCVKDIRRALKCMERAEKAWEKKHNLPKEEEKEEKDEVPVDKAPVDR